MEQQEKITLKMFVDAMRRHPVAVGIVVAAMVAGAAVGVFAYYNGWLG